MTSLLAALASGLLFGLGLTVSAMVDPSKVLNFLDIAGAWDPSLAFVMLAAIPVTAIGFAVARRCGKPLIDTTFRGPTATAIDRRLVVGATLFGIGWGLAGYCPGPALAALSFGNPGTWLFVIAMLVGMAAHELLQAALSRRKRSA